MEKLRPKRKNLLELVDRLHVEKAISKTLKENPNENLINQFVSPNLLNNPRDEVLQVHPGFGSKISRRVYMLRRSRNTEGGSMVCELCGHLSFKLFSIAVEIVDDGKRQTPSQWRRTQTEVVKVCRTCYTEHNSKEHQGVQKTGQKDNARPNFERSFCGITTGRASTSWHFLRRDFVKAKTQALVNHNCFETEFSDKYLQFLDSETKSDSDTCYEDSDVEEKCDTFQLASKGWVSPTSITCIKMNEGIGCKPLSISAVKSDVTLDMMLDAELAITRSNSLRGSPLPTPTSTNQLRFQIFNQTTDSDEKILQILQNSLETPLDIVKEVENPNLICEQSLNGNLLEQGLIDYFTDKPARVRRIKRKRSKSISLCSKKPKLEIKSKPSVYGGLCNLVTIVNPNKGGNKVDSSSTTLYDSQGFEWRRKDLPTYLNFNTTKYINSKQGFRQRKKEIDTFLMEPKSKTVVKYKMPSILDEQHATVSDSDLSQVSEAHLNVPDVSLLMGTNYTEDFPKDGVTMDKENLTVKKEVLEPRRKEVNKLPEKTAKKTEDDLTLASLKKSQRGKEKPKYRCLECRQDLSRKSYHSYSKETAPLMLIKYFKANTLKLRICKACLLKKQSNQHAEDARKRSKPYDRDSSPVPSKVSKSSTSPTAKQSPQTKSKIKTPPKKGSQHTQPKAKNDDQSKSIATRAKMKSESQNGNTMTILNSADQIQLQQLAGNNSTQYVIVKAGNTSSGGGTLQKLSTVVAMESDQASSDITINGKNFKIDSEFKLNELVKDNENAAVLSSDVQKDILSQLPNILKRTIGQRNGSPTSYKIVNVLHTSPTKTGASATSQCTKILPKPSTSVTTSLPSISLQIKEQLRSSNAVTNLPKGLLQPQVPKIKTTNSTSLPTHGPVKPIQLVQVPRVTVSTVSSKKRPIFTSPLNTPVPSKTAAMLSPVQRQKLLNDKTKDSK